MKTEIFNLLQWINDNVESNDWGIKDFFDVDADRYFGTSEKRKLHGKYIWVYDIEPELIKPELIIQTRTKRTTIYLWKIEY